MTALGGERLVADPASLVGRRIVVFGGTGGVGRAVCQGAVAAGARVVIAGRRQARIDELRQELKTVEGVVTDVRDPSSATAAVGRAAEHLGGIDTLIFTPADLRLLRIEEATPEDWRVSWETNVVGAAAVTTAALPHLRASGGRVVLLTSDVVRAPRSGLGLYGVTKRALEGLAIQLRLEIPEVAFTTVTLGPTRPTEMGRVEDYPKFPAYEEQWLTEGIVYRDEARCEDVAAVILSVLTSIPRIDDIVVEPPGGGPR